MRQVPCNEGLGVIDNGGLGHHLATIDIRTRDSILEEFSFEMHALCVLDNVAIQFALMEFPPNYSNGSVLGD